MEEELAPKLPNINIAKIIPGIIIVILLLAILAHSLSFQKKSVIVLPAGGTYLGPTSSPTPIPTASAPAPVSASDEGKFTANDDTAWITVRGNLYPYSFSAPSTLKLVTLPGENKYDIWAISWKGLPPDQNVLIGVDNLNNTAEGKQYITVSKRMYVENWWKSFGGLKGVSSISEFTNSKGLKGYQAHYLTSANQPPSEDVFFEVPDPNYVIHMAPGILASDIFDKIINSVAWTK
jgi:hypothetical protein